MFKPEFIKKLKQSNISTTPEKTAARIRAIWRPLAKNKRAEILTLADVKKPSIERAYKTGNVSAKILISMAQVLEMDPHYILGTLEQARPFENELLVDFLKEFNYDVSKRNLTTTRKRKDAEAINDDALSNDESDCNVYQAQPNLTAIADQLATYFNEDVKNKLADLTDDDLFAMLDSLLVQASINDAKQNHLNIIKYLLLM